MDVFNEKIKCVIIKTNILKNGDGLISKFITWLKDTFHEGHLLKGSRVSSDTEKKTHCIRKGYTSWWLGKKKTMLCKLRVTEQGLAKDGTRARRSWPVVKKWVSGDHFRRLSAAAGRRSAPRRRGVAPRPLGRSLDRSVGRSVGRLDRQRTTSHLRRPSNHETSYRVWHALRDAPLPPTPTPTPTPMAIRNNGSCPTWRSLRCRRFFGHSLAVAVGFFLEALSLSHSLFLCSFFLFIRVGYYRDDHCLRRCRDVSRGSNRRLSADGRADLNNRMTSAVIPRAINKKKRVETKRRKRSEVIFL